MEANTTRDVTELVDNDRQSLEHLLGTQLSESQKVYIMAFTPGREPDAATRQVAADQIDQILDQATAHAQGANVSDASIDEAVDDAMDAIRRREP